MEAAKPDDIVQQIYEHFNRLEYALDGGRVEVKLTTLAKLREICLRARQQDNERLYLQAFRLYHRLLIPANRAQLEAGSPTYAGQLAQHVSGLALRTLEETGWTADKTTEEIAELLIWLTEILTMDFEQRFALTP